MGKQQFDWTPERIAWLRKRRAAGVTILDCSLELGVNLKTITRQCRLLQLPSVNSRGAHLRQATDALGRGGA